MIGQKILELRKNNKMSQEELAEKIGVSRQTISNWELGETAPDLKQAKELSKILNISLDELVGNPNIILEKITNTENNSNILIRLIKVTGITLGILLFFCLVVLGTCLFFQNYYSAEPIASGVGKTCYYKDKVSTITVLKNNQTNKITIDPDNFEIANKFDISKYTDAETLLNDIIFYIEQNGGVCEKEK